MKAIIQFIKGVPQVLQLLFLKMRAYFIQVLAQKVKLRVCF